MWNVQLMLRWKNRFRTWCLTPKVSFRPFGMVSVWEWIKTSTSMGNPAINNYPLVNIQKTMENHHRNSVYSGFSHSNWWIFQQLCKRLPGRVPFFWGGWNAIHENGDDLGSSPIGYEACNVQPWKGCRRSNTKLNSTIIFHISIYISIYIYIFLYIIFIYI